MNISKRMRRRASRKMTAALSALLLVGGAMLVTAPEFAEAGLHYCSTDGNQKYDGDDATGIWAPPEDATADGGKVTVSEGAESGDVVGSISKSADATNGEVVINGGTYSMAEGGNGKAASGNKITLNDGTVSGELAGGVSNDYENPSAAENNTVIMNGGTVNAQWVVGGMLEFGKADNNKVIVTGGKTVFGKGGMGHTGVVGAFAPKAQGNAVSVYGGDLQGHVAGAVAMMGEGTSSLNDNTVNLVGIDGTYDNISGTAFTIGGTVMGAGVIKYDSDAAKYVYDAEMSAGFTGNTINVYGKGITAGNIAGVQNLNFYLPSSMDASKDVILTLTANEVTDLTKTKVAIDATNKTDLTGGNVITLIKKNAGTLSVADDLASTKQDVFIVQSAFKHKSGTISKSENNLILTVSDTDKEPYDPTQPPTPPTPPNPPTPSGDGAFGEGTTEQEQTNMKNVAETRASAAALVNEGADFVQTQAMPQARAAAGASQAAGSSEMAPFAAMGGSNMRYETGSYVNSKGWNGAVGVAKNLGKSTFGVAISYGKSNYDSHMDNGTEGSGSSSATGLTLFSEWKNDNGIYSDVALRFGRVKSDYKATLSNGGVPVYTAYENSSNYYGFSVGGGKEIALGENGDSVDIYGRYFYTHTNGSDTTTNTNDQLSFSGMDSNRIRIGSRYNHKMNDKNVFYTGLAWQYEFSGEAKTTVNGLGAPVPGLKGHSGMLEIGTKIQANNNLTVDLNLNGWAGKQRGISGGVGLNFTF